MKKYWIILFALMLVAFIFCSITSLAETVDNQAGQTYVKDNPQNTNQQPQTAPPAIQPPSSETKKIKPTEQNDLLSPENQKFFRKMFLIGLILGGITGLYFSLKGK